MKVEVDMQMAHDAWKSWYDYHDQTYNEALRSFEAFAGIRSWLERHMFVSEEQFHRIKMLASPHARTLLKAHYARQEAENGMG